MLNLIITILANGLGIFVASRWVAGFGFTGGFGELLLTGAVLGVFFMILKPVLKVLSFPVILLTLGLFSLVINAFLLWLLTLVVPVLTIQGLGAYVWGTILITIINLVAHRMAK